MEKIDPNIKAGDSGVYPVTAYRLFYSGMTDKPVINISYLKAGQTWSTGFSPTAEAAIYIADMLRNEKPVYLYERSALLQTGPEVVGEGEI